MTPRMPSVKIDVKSELVCLSCCCPASDNGSRFGSDSQRGLLHHDVRDCTQSNMNSCLFRASLPFQVQRTAHQPLQAQDDIGQYAPPSPPFPAPCCRPSSAVLSAAFSPSASNEFVRAGACADPRAAEPWSAGIVMFQCCLHTAFLQVHPQSHVQRPKLSGHSHRFSAANRHKAAARRTRRAAQR